MSAKPKRRLVQLALSRIDLVDAPDNPGARVMLFKRRDDDDDVEKAKWTVAFINTLPDSSFAVIEPGGKKDDEGKTAPRSLRHLPFKDAGGEVDLPHLRAALSRLPQTKIPANLKAKAMGRLRAAARKAGVKVSKSDVITAFRKMGEGYASPVARTTDEILLERDTFDQWHKVKWAFNDSLSAILGAAPTAERMSLLQKSVDEFVTRVEEILPDAMAKQVREALSDLEPEEGPETAMTVLSALDLAPLTRRATLKRDSGTQPDPEDGMDEKAIKDLQKRAADAEENLKKRDADLKTATERVEALEVEVKKLRGESDDELKGLPEEARKRIEKTESVNADLQKRLDAADETTATGDIEKRLRPLHLVGTTAEQLAPVIRRVEKGKATEEDVTELERLLSSQSDLIRKGRALEELGGSGAVPAEDDPVRRVEHLAIEKMKKDEAKSLPEAITAVLNENPGLYRKYTDAVGKGERPA